MSIDYRPDVPDPKNDKDDEIVALSKALKDQVRELRRHLRPEALTGEAPSFAPDGKPTGDQEP
jgi:hypothetical protein